jgi:hypothetical protein
MLKFVKVFIFVLLISLSGCERNALQEPIPFVPVNLVIDLNNISSQALRFDRGFIYVEEGVRGIIIYRVSQNQFRAFERNCTFQPNAACAKVEVDGSGLFMTDPCCKSVFDFEGNPVAGPAAFPLFRYRTSLSGSLLSVIN